MADDQTQAVRFESMRKQSKHKKLFRIHQDLKKECERHIMKLSYDAKMASFEKRQDKKLMLGKLRKFKEEKQVFEMERQKTRLVFEEMDKIHANARAITEGKLNTTEVANVASSDANNPRNGFQRNPTMFSVAGAKTNDGNITRRQLTTRPGVKHHFVTRPTKV